MYAYALPTPTFTTAWGHYSRLSSPIGGGIARGNRGDGSSSTFDDGWRVARPGTDTTDARSEFAFSSPFRSPQPRINHSGSLLADLWKWGGKRREDEGSRVLSLRSSLPLFVLGDVYRDIEVVGGWLLSVLAWRRMAPMGVFGWLLWTIVTIFDRFLFRRV